MRQVVLDTETTGLSPQTGDRLIEIGCVEMIDRKLTGNTFHRYINPMRDVNPGAFKVHGISTEFLQDKPLFKEVKEELKDFIEGAELIIHNAPFDVGFLEFEFKLLDDPWENLEEFCHITDTLMMARQMHPGQKNNLDALCKRYEINNAHRTKHGALLDAEILAELYLVMTGGQTDMGLEIQQDEASPVFKLNTKGIELPILYATLEENQAHEAYLEKINK